MSSPLPDDPQSATDHHFGGASPFNVLWLSGLAHNEAALVVADHPDELVRELAPRFNAVHAHSIAHARTTRGRNGDVRPPVTLPFPDATFDLIALWSYEPGVFGLKRRPSAVRALLSECRRVLRDGGCLHLTTRERFVRHRLERPLRNAGFRDVKAYYTTPSHTDARCLIPASRRAVMAFERVRHGMSESSRVRLPIARLGLHRFLFPSRLYLAYA